MKHREGKRNNNNNNKVIKSAFISCVTILSDLKLVSLKFLKG